MKKTIATVHYNTPELTEALVKSIRKVGMDWPIVILDNSDSRPFTKRMKGVKVINNRKGQLIDFEKELAKYPDKCAELAHKGNFASAKHQMSVQYLMDVVLPDGFILMDSDILLKKSPAFLWDEHYAAAGRCRWYKTQPKPEQDKLLPFLCYLNAPLLREHGARFYDPERSWGLMPGGKSNPQNLYDTGAAVFEDIVRTKPALWCRNWQNLELHFEHFGAASYREDKADQQQAWLEQHRALWE
jgi:hypothetical protein